MFSCVESWHGAFSTSTVAVEVLLSTSGFGTSAVLLETVAVFEITVPFGTVPTWYVAIKKAVSPRARLAMVQTVEPVSPTFGLVQLNTGPASRSKDAKVVFAGTSSESWTAEA